jgi:hypothetical protein
MTWQDVVAHGITLAAAVILFRIVWGGMAGHE